MPLPSCPAQLGLGSLYRLFSVLFANIILHIMLVVGLDFYRQVW